MLSQGERMTTHKGVQLVSSFLDFGLERFFIAAKE